jgi:hypothetical protein
MEYLDARTACANIDLLFDQRERHGIPRTVDFDMIVRCNTGALPPGEDIRLGRQRLKVGPVQRRSSPRQCMQFSAKAQKITILLRP